MSKLFPRMFKRQAVPYKLIGAIIAIAILSGGYFFFKAHYLAAPLSHASSTKPTVAISQIVPHPSLDAIRQGIIDTLIQQGVKAEEIIFENAMGSIATATQIGEKFISKKPRVIVTITTPTTQAIYKLARKAGIPVIFAAITDPVSAKLVPAMDQTGQGITGVSDLLPIKEQLHLMRLILPQLKKLGVLYNPGEANSVALVERLAKICTELNLQLLGALAHSTAEVVTATRALVGAVDAIYIPNDNSVVSALMSVLQIANKAKVPVFADPGSVEKGCLAALAYNQYQLGVQTGQMVVELLKGTPLPKLIPAYGRSKELYINLDVAAALGIKISKDLQQQADQLYPQSKS